MANRGESRGWRGSPPTPIGGEDTFDAQGSTAANVLVGGAGDDTLTAGSGRGMLLGGLGSDILNAVSGDDLLIGALTDYDTDLAVLALLRRE